MDSSKITNVTFACGDLNVIRFNFMQKNILSNRTRSRLYCHISYNFYKNKDASKNLDLSSFYKYFISCYVTKIDLKDTNP